MSNAKEDVVNELHKPARRNFPRRRVIIKGLDDLFQADIGEFQEYASVNKQFRYVLFVIDCFSKYLWTEPLKTKNAVDVRDGMQKILLKGRVCRNLQTDMGKEFYNKHFKELMEKYNINHYSSYTVKKASIVERVIRTIKNKLYKHFSLIGKYKWIDVIDSITLTYNKTKHRTINMRPSDVTLKNEKKLLSSVYTPLKMKKTKSKKKKKNRFNVGDIVRISKYKTLFSKGYTPNWSTELFKINRVNIKEYPPTYTLIDLNNNPILGSFYQEEIQLAKHTDVYLVEKILKYKGSKVYVKFLGLSNEHNTWLDKKDLL